MVNITINGKSVISNVANLAELLREHNFTQNWLATAVNSNLIKQDEREKYQLQDGDKIEILTPMQGG